MWEATTAQQKTIGLKMIWKKCGNKMNKYFMANQFDRQLREWKMFPFPDLAIA